MKTPRYLATGLIMTLLGAAPAFADTSAQDSSISVYPVVHRFPVTTLGTSSSPALFTVTNTGSSDLTISSVVIAGVNSGQFTLGTNNCVTTLSAGSSCTVAASFTPTTTGTKNAYLEIHTSLSSTPVLSAFLTNGFDAIVEARRRIPPTLTSVTMPVSPMSAGASQIISWTVEGYDADYTSQVVMFDCTGVTAGSCGNSYSDSTKFYESSYLTATTGPGNWHYSGVNTTSFTYTLNATLPATRSGGSPWSDSGTDVVVRFYLKSDIDKARGNAGVSLLIPGNQGITYYDSVGRRILTQITP